MKTITCPLCGKQMEESMVEMACHLLDKHAKEKEFRYAGPYDNYECRGCREIHRSWYCFVKHMYDIGRNEQELKRHMVTVALTQ